MLMEQIFMSAILFVLFTAIVQFLIPQFSS
jgi:hypothetical protein